MDQDNQTTPSKEVVSRKSRILRWAQSESLWYFSTGDSCCVDESFQAFGCKYDLERFGCLPTSDIEKADLLIVNGVVTYKSGPFIKALFEQMSSPKYVMALGSCACNGGLFGDALYQCHKSASEIIPVDIFVPGCPPRPEAVMNGFLLLQDKIRNLFTSVD